MKATINPKDEFSNRHKKYNIRFDDNEKYRAWLNDYIVQNQFRIPIVPDCCNYKQEAENGDASYIYIIGMFYARGFWCDENYQQGHEMVEVGW
jgi:hypothetical protein